MIRLGLALLQASSNLPARHTNGDFCPKIGKSCLFDLAPGRVYLAHFVTKMPVRSYHTISPLLNTSKKVFSGIISVALALRCKHLAGSYPVPSLLEPGLSSRIQDKCHCPATAVYCRSHRLRVKLPFEL